MSCTGEKKAQSEVLAAAARVAGDQVDGASRCLYPGCGQPLTTQEGCPSGHSQCPGDVARALLDATENIAWWRELGRAPQLLAEAQGRAQLALAVAEEQKDEALAQRARESLERVAGWQQEYAAGQDGGTPAGESAAARSAAQTHCLYPDCDAPVGPGIRCVQGHRQDLLPLQGRDIDAIREAQWEDAPSVVEAVEEVFPKLRGRRWRLNVEDNTILVLDAGAGTGRGRCIKPLCNRPLNDQGECPRHHPQNLTVHELLLVGGWDITPTRSQRISTTVAAIKVLAERWGGIRAGESLDGLLSDVKHTVAHLQTFAANLRETWARAAGEPSPDEAELAAQEERNALRVALRSRSAAVRLAAIQALAADSSTEATNLIAPFCRDDDAEVRYAAYHALWDRPAAPWGEFFSFPNALAEDDARIRQEAVLAAAKMGNTPWLLAALADDDRTVCRRAVVALGDLGATEAIEPLVRLLPRTPGGLDRETVTAIGVALRTMGSAAVAPLRRVWQEATPEGLDVPPDTDLRGVIVATLAAIPGDESTAALTAIVQGYTPNTEIEYWQEFFHAADALAGRQAAGIEMIAALEPLLSQKPAPGETDYIHKPGIKLLGRVGRYEQGARHWLRQGARRWPEWRKQVFQAMGATGNAEFAPYLEKWVGPGPNEERMAAVEALCNLPPEVRVGPLEQAVLDPRVSVGVLSPALDGLLSAGPAGAPALVHILRTGLGAAPYYTRRLREEISRHGGRELVPELEEIADSERFETVVRDAARDAVIAIQVRLAEQA